MKAWKSPEMKVFSVKMDENIAASGESVYETGDIYYIEQGTIYRVAGRYSWSDGGNIQDTGITFEMDEFSNRRVIAEDQKALISGCLA